ncbi:MAG: hypothetical protein ONB05_07830, partial [candidate division KSB1 bacterium]|nr:hypothetical protein [candidate division KSB1 bacterium]
MENNNPKQDFLICIRCPRARFPEPHEQCYKFGGLICTVDNSNVGKYDSCKFRSKEFSCEND